MSGTGVLCSVRSWSCFLLLATAILSNHIATSQTTTEANSGDDGGLKSADIISIVLGVCLLIVIIVALVVCCLYTKGYVGRDYQIADDPYLPDVFSTTPESLQHCSKAALDKMARDREDMVDRQNQSSIIYMNDDIYHPPKTRPLPGNGVKADYFPEAKRLAKKPSHSIRQLFSNKPLVTEGVHRPQPQQARTRTQTNTVPKPLAPAIKHTSRVTKEHRVPLSMLSRSPEVSFSGVSDNIIDVTPSSNRMFLVQSSTPRSALVADRHTYGVYKEA